MTGIWYGMLCDKFCTHWLLPCMDVLECVINTIQYNTIQYSITYNFIKYLDKTLSRV
jgi:hypothetical protein